MRDLNLFLVKRNDTIGRDEFDSSVIAAFTAEGARLFAIANKDFDSSFSDSNCISIDIGRAIKGTKQLEVITSSFNAG